MPLFIRHYDELPGSIADAIDAYLLKQPDHKSKWAKQLTAKLVSAMGDQPIEQLQWDTLAKWCEMVGYSSSTTRHLGSLLRCVIEDATGTKPAWRLPPGGVRAMPSSNDISKVYRACPGPLKRLLLMLQCTGARPGEIAGLRFEQLDSSLERISIDQHKTAHHGKIRFLLLSPLAQRLVRHLGRKHQWAGYIFRNSHNEPWTPQAIRRAVGRARARAGVRGVVAYHQRHKFAVDAVRANVDLATIAQLMGHSRLETTRKYLHVDDPDHLREQIERFRK